MDKISFTAGGRERALRYTMGALCRMEEEAGCPLDEITQKEFTALRLLLWGALLHEDASLRPDGAAALADEYLAEGGTLGDLAEKCAAALEASGVLRA